MAESNPPVEREVTTSEQASAHNYQAKTVRSAAHRWDPVARDDPSGAKRVGLGIAVSALAVASVIALVLAVFRPNANAGMDKIVIGQEGGLLVLYTGEDGVERLHPVLNVASARLIAGTAQRPKMIKDTVLGEKPYGMPMGIPGAPNSFLYRSEADSAWQVCDWHDSRTNLSLTKAESLRTTLIAGNDVRDGGDSLGSDRAVLVRVADNPQPWLLFRNTRTKVGATDYTMHAALGIGTDRFSSPLVVSDGLLNSIPPVPDLSLPKLKDLGKPSPEVSGFAVGDVLAYRDLDNIDRYAVVEKDGVQDVPFVVARMVVSGGGVQKNVAEASTVAHMKRSSEISLQNYPEAIPRLVDPDTLCFRWNRHVDSNRASIDIVTSNAIPVTEKARNNTVELLRTVSNDAASKYVSKPGEGWYVRFTGEGEYSDAREQLAYIDSSGILYPILPDEQGVYTRTANTLGLSGTPNLIPASIASLFLPGPDLSPEAAKRADVQNNSDNGKPKTEDGRIVGGQEIPLPPQSLPTVTATQTQVQTQTATVSASAPPPPSGASGPPPSGAAGPPQRPGAAPPRPAGPPTNTPPPR